MSQRLPEGPDQNSGLQLNYVESMPGGNAELMPNTHQDLETVFPHPKWAANQEPLHEIHPNQPSPPRSRRLRILIFTVIALVCMGIGIGVGVGISRGTRKGGDSEAEAPPSITSSTNSPTASVIPPTASAIPPAIPTSLHVLAAVHGNAIVTPEAKQLVDAQGSIAFDSHPFPFRDNMYVMVFSHFQNQGIPVSFS